MDAEPVGVSKALQWVSLNVLIRTVPTLLSHLSG
jgi:hypothetical protein